MYGLDPFTVKFSLAMIFVILLMVSLALGFHWADLDRTGWDSTRSTVCLCVAVLSALGLVLLAVKGDLGAVGWIAVVQAVALLVLGITDRSEVAS